MHALWFPLILLATIFWATSNLIDGNLVAQKVKNISSLLIAPGILSILPGLFVVISGNWTTPNLQTIFIGICAGFVSLFVYYPYLKALRYTDPARAVLIWNAAPVLVTLLAFIFLHELFSSTQYLGIALLVASSISAQWTKSLPTHKSHLATQAIPWMLLASCLTATEVILQKAMYVQTTLPTGLVLLSIGNALGVLCILLQKTTRQEVRQMISRKETRGLIFLNEGITQLGSTTTSIAISLGPVTLVNAVGGIQPLMILVIAAILRYTRPNFKLPKPDLHTWQIFLATTLGIFGLFLLGQ